MQPTCNDMKCMLAYSEEHLKRSNLNKQREQRKDTKRKLDSLKSLPELMSEAQVAFNAYIRARDIKAGHGCIDCGKPCEPNKPGGSIDAGHYLSRGSSSHLKFNEDNCFAQRKNCNRPGGTTRDAFRAGVEARIGREALEALEADHHVHKWTKDELRAIKALYVSKMKELKK